MFTLSSTEKFSSSTEKFLSGTEFQQLKTSEMHGAAAPKIVVRRIQKQRTYRQNQGTKRIITHKLAINMKINSFLSHT